MSGAERFERVRRLLQLPHALEVDSEFLCDVRDLVGALDSCLVALEAEEAMSNGFETKAELRAARLIANKLRRDAIAKARGGG